MPPTCSICAHAARRQIDEALIAGQSLRDVARQHGVGHQSLHRHKKACQPSSLRQLPAIRREYHEVRERTAALNIAAELGVVLQRARLLADACDRWLRDPVNEEQYDVGPRSDEVSVVYEETDTEGKLQRKRAKLDHLLARIQSGLGVTISRTEIRHADVRELILKAQAGSVSVIRDVVGMMRDAVELQSRLDAAAKIREMSEAEVKRELTRVLHECGLSERAVEGLLARLQATSRECAMAEAEAALAEMQADAAPRVQ